LWQGLTRAIRRFDLNLPRQASAGRKRKAITDDFRRGLASALALMQGRRGRGPEAAGELPSPDMIADRVMVAVAPVAGTPYVPHAAPLAAYVGDVIDVGIEILPMKELQAQMSSGVAYYEGELYNLIREGRGVPAVPLVLVGVAP
jgi:hypothetical protein